MNALSKSERPSQGEMIRVLQNSLYPGAAQESIELVLSYCRVHQVDPMLKPVHIVRMSVEVAPGKWEYRDVLMPGIADYRIKAARSGEYAGKSEPEFGPVKSERIGDVTVNYPEWCRVTIYRLVGGQPRPFTAVERWLENYATSGKNNAAPNTMWRRRAFGQLAKCAEAQALRMAFPEFSGATPTAEEMEGKEFDGATIEARAEQPSPTPRRKPDKQEWLDGLALRLATCSAPEQVEAIIAEPAIRRAIEAARMKDPGALETINRLITEALAKCTAADEADDFPGDTSDTA